MVAILPNAIGVPFHTPAVIVPKVVILADPAHVPDDIWVRIEFNGWKGPPIPGMSDNWMCLNTGGP